MNHYIQVVTSVGSRTDAQAIARTLVERRLAGCVQVVGPITSTYWWEGKVEEAEEYLCLIKTRQDMFTTLEATIASLHPYDVPEILALPVSAGSQRYLDWLKSELVIHSK